MLFVIETVLAPATVALALANTFFVLQCLLGCRPPGRIVVTASDRGPAAILIPAHNEEATIGHVINSLKPQMLKYDRLIVVADNCSDETASVAAGAGAEVVIRHDEQRRGKAYALHAGLQSISGEQQPVVVMIDADCIVAPGALHHLITEAMSKGRPVQGCYLMVAPSSRNAHDRLSEFAFLIKNRVRPLGLSRLGLACQLTGSGMAFPYAFLSQVNFQHGHLVEDIKLGIEFASIGLPPCYCDAALLTSEFPLSKAGKRSQRQRWEKGRLQFAASLLRRLLALSSYKDPRLFFLIVDALIPPIILWGCLLVFHVSATGALALAGASSWQFLVSLANFSALTGALACVWVAQGQMIIRPADLSILPRYILARMKLYPSVLLHGPSQWIRTSRSAEDA